jgi:DNA-binding IclR family transcriptional regulator
MPGADKLAGEIEDREMAQKYIVPGLQRGLQILQVFSRDRTEIGAPEIAKELGIPRSTVFRLMQTLEFMGFIERAKNSSEYRLGVSVLSLGFEYFASLEFTELARPILEKLRDDTGFSAHLVIRDGWDVVFVLKAAAKDTFSNSVNVGLRLPAHSSILGRMLLADLSAAELKQVFPEGKLSKFSDQTPTTLAEMSKLLNEDRKRGCAIGASYFQSGIGSISAQIKDNSHRVVAAINVIYHDSTVKRSDVEGKYLKRVLQAAGEISRLLDYHPGSIDGNTGNYP